MYDWYSPNVDIEMMMLNAVVLARLSSESSITGKVARLLPDVSVPVRVTERHDRPTKPSEVERAASDRRRQSRQSQERRHRVPKTR